MLPFYRSRAALVGIGLTVASLAAIGFIPLFGGPGYESALAAGILVPIFVAAATALEIAYAHPAPLDAFWKAMENGAVFGLAAYATTLAHGLRVGFCDALGGSLHFALGAGVGSLLGGAWGAVAGEIAGRRGPRSGRRAAAILLAALGPLASFAVSVARFYTSPMVFAYDPFAGYFSGTLYDTIVNVSGLVTYRVGSAATLLFAGLFASRLARTPEGRLARASSSRLVVSAFAAAALAASLAMSAYGDRFSHWHTRATVAAALGGSWVGARCDVVFPRGLDPKAVERFGQECDAHVAAGERWFDAPFPFRITAFLFADAAQKGALMGAANTYVAKPWRREIYVQEAGYPHPTLGHELIHVIAGHFARGPFKVAGTSGGWIPDPGLIEGVAVAGSPREGDLSPREWAKAMKDLGILPPLSKLFSLGFLNQSSASAYTASGAFVGYVRERFGPAAVRAWYGGMTLPEATGSSLEELEASWHKDLATIELTDAVRVQAKARFDRPAIFGRRCPRVVDACKALADDLQARGDAEGAVRAYQDAIALDPGDFGLRIAAAKASIGPAGQVAAKSALELVAGSEAAPRFARDKALEEIADLELAAGDLSGAASRYREVLERVVSEDTKRTLDVKIAAATGKSELGRRAIVELLIGDPERGPDKTRAVELLASWAAAEPDDGTPLYLLARQYFSAGRLDAAALHLDQALARRLPIARVHVEALRLRLIVACGLGDSSAARRLLADYAASPGVSAARREAAESLTERCAGVGALSPSRPEERK